MQTKHEIKIHWISDEETLVFFPRILFTAFPQRSLDVQIWRWSLETITPLSVCLAVSLSVWAICRVLVVFFLFFLNRGHVVKGAHKDNASQAFNFLLISINHNSSTQNHVNPLTLMAVYFPPSVLSFGSFLKLLAFLFPVVVRSGSAEKA